VDARLRKQILRKAKRFRDVEWKYRARLRTSIREISQFRKSHDLPPLNAPDIASTIHAFLDGCVLVRHARFQRSHEVAIHLHDTAVENWRECSFVPVSETEELMFRAIGISVAGPEAAIEFCDLKLSFNDGKVVVLPYLGIQIIDYDADDQLEEPLFDLRLALQQLAEQKGLLTEKHLNKDEVISGLRRIRAEFAELIDKHGDQERAVLQPFIEAHPTLLAPGAEVYPQQKLGIDFIADFLIVYPGDQGVSFALVEIEPATCKLFKQVKKKERKPSPRPDRDSSDFHGDFTHALKQTVDWSAWLERNQSHMRDLVPGFETPKLILVIGRSIGLSERQKSELRACQRQWNIVVRTYDDLLAGVDQHIASLEAIHNEAN